MGLRDFVSTVATKASAVGELAGDKVSEWVSDYQKATKTLESLGFEIGKFTIGMGVMPEMHTTLSGKVANIDPDQIEALKQKHQEEASTVMLLKALLLAKQISDHFEGKLQSVTLHIRLGMPPSVDVEVH